MSRYMHRTADRNIARSFASKTLPVATTLALFLGLAVFSQFTLANPIELSKKIQLTVTGNLPNGVATESYAGSVKASAGTAPYVYKAGGLPKGLTLNHDTGSITGSSSSTGQFSFNIYVTDSAGNHGQGAFTVTFAQPPVSISLAPNTLKIASSGTQQFLPTVSNTTNTAVTWAVSQGTMSSSGSYTAPEVTSDTAVTITATSVADNTKSATANLTISPTTAAPVALELLYPPTSIYQPYYADVQKYLLNNSLVAGVNFWLEWGTVDKGPTSNPQYDFSAFDAAIAPWIAAGKKINVVVWAVSDTPVNNGTPSYVFSNLGSSNITTCAGEKIPNYFNSAFQLPYQAFMKQVVKHFGSNGSIGYIRFGLGRGGETFPSQNFGSDPCTSTFVNKWGWTDTTWTNYVNAMLAYESTLKSPKQLMVGLDSVDSNDMPDSEAAAAISMHIAIGNQGMKANDITKYPHCSSDWCDLFAEYKNSNLPLELQTIALSSPQGNAPVGSLVTLLPFAVQNHATVLEIYTYDWLLAFDPSYPGYSTYGAAYASTFKAAAQGK
ncbi:MAG TPA: putative Ig domain-containing protein [Candidatus Sulfotelmatobacter sp.]